MSIFLIALLVCMPLLLKFSKLFGFLLGAVVTLPIMLIVLIVKALRNKSAKHA